jgi:hypothetical protein
MRSTRQTTRATSGVALGVIAAAASLVCGANAAAAKGGASGSTEVLHGVVFVVVSPDDICGPNPAEITYRVRTQVLHSTEEDGQFNVQFTQTGTYRVDFTNPDVEDQVAQYTESIHHVFTPGETEVFNFAYHDFPDGVRIWQRTHMTVVDGQLVVERVIDKVTGCP